MQAYSSLKLGIVVASVTVTTLVMGTEVQAALVTFSDRTLFNLAAPGLQFEDFEAFNVPFGNAITFNAPIDSTTNNGTISPGDIAPGLRFSTPTNGEGLTASGDGILGLTSQKLFANAGFDSLVIDFTATTNAVGLDLVTRATSANVQISIFGASGLLGTQTVLAANTAVGSFFGVTSETDLITRITLSDASNQTIIGVDNIAYDPVPTPIMLPSFMGLGLALLRQRQRVL